MDTLTIGTDAGVFRLAENSRLEREDGPPSAVYLARGAGSVYAVTREGALWERKDGSGWTLVNERPVPDEVWSLGADPRMPGRLFLGVSPALLYRSEDGGRSWTACDAIRAIPGYETWTFPPPPHIPHVRSVAPDPVVPGGVYIGVEEGGVYRGDPRGETWQSLNEGLYWDVHTVTPLPGGERVYATTGGGFYRSDDGGGHWQKLEVGLDRRYVVPFLASPAEPGLVLMAGAAGPPPTWVRGADAAIYRSTDGGDHWQQLTRGLPARLDAMVMALALGSDGTVYAAAGLSLFAGAGHGDEWRVLSENLPHVRALLAA